MPPKPIRDLLLAARRRLAAAGCEQAALDARLLLQDAAGLTHADIIAEPDHMIGEAGLRRFKDHMARREAREPVSRILGTREFFGRSFQVTPAVLDPRPETETLIEAALQLAKDEVRILDLGTGSGAIIVILLAECPTATGVATDISAEALAVARANAQGLAGGGGRLQFVHGSWFDAVTGHFDLIVSNPPYIPAVDIASLPPDVRDFDPLTALDGGADGLDAYREIAAGAAAHLVPGGRILLEIGAGQERSVVDLFEACGFHHDTSKADLGGHVRCLVFART